MVTPRKVHGEGVSGWGMKDPAEPGFIKVPAKPGF